MTPQAVQKWEAGTSQPKGSRLKAVADALGRSVSWLLDEHEAAAEYQITDSDTTELARGVTPHPSSKTASAQPAPTPEEIANALEWAMRPAGLDLSALGGRAVVVTKIQIALGMQRGGVAKPEITIMDLTKPDPAIPGISAPEEHKKAS